MPYGNDRFNCSWSQTAEALQCPPGDSIHQFILNFIQERACLKVLLSHSKDSYHSHAALTFIQFTLPRRHSQTHFQRRCLGHTSFSMHGDRRIYSVPCFQPGIYPFIEHPSRTGKVHLFTNSSRHYNLHDPRHDFMFNSTSFYKQ